MERRRLAPYDRPTRMDFWSPIIVAVIAPPCVWLLLQTALTVDYFGNVLSITDLYPTYYVVFFMAGWIATICFTVWMMVVYDYKLQCKKINADES